MSVEKNPWDSWLREIIPYWRPETTRNRIHGRTWKIRGPRIRAKTSSFVFPLLSVYYVRCIVTALSTIPEGFFFIFQFYPLMGKKKTKNNIFTRWWRVPELSRSVFMVKQWNFFKNLSTIFFYFLAYGKKLMQIGNSGYRCFRSKNSILKKHGKNLTRKNFNLKKKNL